MLIQITAPHFCAGVELGVNGVGVRAAPIIRYMRGWSLQQIATYCTKKKWHMQVVSTKL
jgi:hypothetical protein